MLVLPLVSGVRIISTPEALHYWTVPELVYGMNSAILFGTDIFFAGYAVGK
jgi:acyl-[acyl-carrier-protein]-phospholipid O-acyltransferase/long-chain-fatty-acid--[acyl-carrier-protein] ligase